ncbi:O-fucosyltransferase 31-like protein, partial [Drosera capensis]
MRGIGWGLRRRVVYGMWGLGGGGGHVAAGLLMLVLPMLLPGLFGPLGHASPSMLSEWNGPESRHMNLLKGALQTENSDGEQSDLWEPLPDQGWKPCLQPTESPSKPEKSSGYLQVFLDGGLNQQRMGICDAVAVAKSLNATLVIPYLEVNPVWKDSSSFEDIFDVDHFIEALKDD